LRFEYHPRSNPRKKYTSAYIQLDPARRSIQKNPRSKLFSRVQHIINPVIIMVNIHLSYTAPINPPDTTPVLNPHQIRAGLQRKIRAAQEFVPVIISCDVLEDKDGVVTRDVKFKPGAGPKDQAREVVKSFYPSWVRYLLPLF
jgi:hypothetical protein